MKGEISLWLCIIILVSLVSTVALTNTAMASSTTMIYMDPHVSTAAPGEQFDVQIKIANVKWLYAWEFHLKWNSILLEAISVTEGPFLQGSPITRETFFQPKINNTSGEIDAACTLQGVLPLNAPSGNGTLAVITFSVKGEGGSSLDLHGTKLVKFLDNEPIIIPHTVDDPSTVEEGDGDGYFTHPLPKLGLDPSSILDPNLGPGSTFNININISKVVGLYAWQFFLKWDPNLLDATSVTEGPFLSQEGAQQTEFFNDIDQVAGSAYVNCTLVGKPVPTASGNGTLAVIGFLVESRGSTVLDLDEIKLIDIDEALIPHGLEDGYFINAVHDVAVTLVEASPNEVRPGDSVSISVVLKNEGNVAETDIDVTVTYDTAFIGTLGVASLDAGQETTLTFTWDTSDVDEGEYAIRAEASTVLGETDIADNIRDMDGTVRVTSLGQMLPLSMLIIGVIVVVAVVGIGLFFYTRRKP